jgi:hypothetical protein
MYLCMKRAVFMITLAVVTIFLNCVDYSHDGDDEENTDRYIGPTTVIATNYRTSYPLLIDDDALYLERSSTTAPGPQPGDGGTLISRIDKITGDTSTLKFSGPEKMALKCLDGGYLYFTGQDLRVYRASKAGGTAELVKSFGGAIHSLKVVGDKMYVRLSAAGLFCYSIPRDTTTTITDDQVLWFDIDEHSLFWSERQRDSVTQLRTIWEMRLDGGAPIERVTDDFYVVRMMGDYICYWSDSTDELMSFCKESGKPEALFPSRSNLVTEDDAYVLVGDMLYVSNCGGGLWRLPVKDPVNGAAMIDRWGGFDDDDYAPKVVSDGVALYWFAGPDVHTRISDEDMGVLLKTCLAP